MISENVLTEQLVKLAEYIKTAITSQTIALYGEKMNTFDDNAFNSAIKYLYKNWKYSHFPLIADFYEAYKAVRPTTSNYKPEPRDDAAYNPLTDIQSIRLGLQCQDIIKKQLLQPIYGKDYDSGFNYKEKRDGLKKFLSDKVKAGECFSLQAQRWGKREKAVTAENYYFYPDKFGW